MYKLVCTKIEDFGDRYVASVLFFSLVIEVNLCWFMLRYFFTFYLFFFACFYCEKEGRRRYN